MHSLKEKKKIVQPSSSIHTLAASYICLHFLLSKVIHRGKTGRFIFGGSRVHSSSTEQLYKYQHLTIVMTKKKSYKINAMHVCVASWSYVSTMDMALFQPLASKLCV